MDCGPKDSQNMDHQTPLEKRGTMQYVEEDTSLNSSKVQVNKRGKVEEQEIKNDMGSTRVINHPCQKQ